jgi:Protein of unknown function (DUF3177)
MQNHSWLRSLVWIDYPLAVALPEQDNIWFRPLVWMDYRLALLFTVIIPLALLIWAVVQKSAAIQRLLIIYWRVASLLAITVYMMIGSLPISFVSSLMARILIPLSLWFWGDINEEINDLPQRELKLAVTSWRWAITIYSGIGLLTQTIPFLSCAVAKQPSDEPFCRVWLEPTWLYREFFHPRLTTQFLSLIGILGLIVYILYLSYFIFVRLGKQGRSAMEQ